MKNLKMPSRSSESLKTFANRCRCCLERFFFDEKPSQITNFFKIQFNSFTQIQLQDEDDLLSRHVCEFCHSELLRFSLFKKDLIEKQQKLNELLKLHLEKNVKKSKSRAKRAKILQAVSEIEVIISTPDQSFFKENIKTEILEPVDDSKEEKDLLIVASDDEKDQDFLIVSANENFKLKCDDETKPEIAKKGQFTCDYCLKFFKAKQGLTRHVQSHIENSVPWKCGEINCDFSAKSKNKLNTHKTAHKIESPLQENTTAVAAEITQVKIEDKHEKEFICFCGASFEFVRSLCAHKNRVHGGFKKCTYGCQNVQYIKTGHYIRHVQSRHPEHLSEILKKLGQATYKEGFPQAKNMSTQFFSCDLCAFKTLRKSSIRSHLERHLPYSARVKFGCKVCNKQFTRPSSLRVHRETVHELLRKYKCPKCSESFKQAGHLNDHIANKHKKLNIKHFRCTLCQKMFQKRYMLNKHMTRSHKKSRQVPVATPLITSIKSKKNKILKKQMKNKGVMVKNFRCQANGCTHNFTARCNLLRHQKQKGHLPPSDLKRIKFICDCGEQFFSYRGYEYHCDRSDCKLRSKTTKHSDIP